MKKLFMVASLVSLVLFAGCKGKTKVDETLAGKWETAVLEKDGAVQTLVISDMNLEPEKGDMTKYKIWGNSGINTYNGNIVIKDGKVIPDDKMLSTKMAGSPEDMSFEDLFLEGLTGADKAEIIVNESGEKFLEFTNSIKKIKITFKKGNKTNGS